MRCRHDDDAQVIQRPMTFPSRRRPISESVRNRPEMRYRAENLLDLKMEILGSTTKVYKKPEVSPALKEVFRIVICIMYLIFYVTNDHIEGTQFCVGSRS